MKNKAAFLGDVCFMGYRESYKLKIFSLKHACPYIKTGDLKTAKLMWCV